MPTARRQRTARRALQLAARHSPRPSQLSAARPPRFGSFDWACTSWIFIHAECRAEERSRPKHGTSLTRGQQPSSPTAQHPRCGRPQYLPFWDRFPFVAPPPNQHQTGRRRRLCLSSAAFQAVDRDGEARRRHGDARGGEDRRVRYGPLDPSEGPGQHRRLAR